MMDQNQNSWNNIIYEVKIRFNEIGNTTNYVRNQSFKTYKLNTNTHKRYTNLFN